MRKVTTAKTAGFCFGVKRAVDMVYEQLEREDIELFTYGPIIHNEEVVNDLKKRGVHVLEEEDLVQFEQIEDVDCPDGTHRRVAVIRAHGVPKDIYERLGAAGFELIDATCPFVLKIHRYVKEYIAKGYHILIIGNPSHPEVEGIRSWGEIEQTTVLNTEKEAESFTLNDSEKLCVVSQTTFNYNKFQDLVEIIKEKGYDIIVLNTICSATETRQKEAAELAKQSEAMIVIGGRNSSNTQKLFEICKKECENTYYIQTVDDLDLQKLQSIDNVGITAGASTPNKIIEEVQTNVRNEF